VSSIDWKFIGAQEGNAWTRAYVPTTRGQYLGDTAYDQVRHGQVLGQSGVTVATGFDIGQHNDWELGRLGLARDLYMRLKPYLLLKKMAAVRKLEQARGFTISADEARAIDMAVKMGTAKKLEFNYDTAVLVRPKALCFGKLPGEIQTAIASFAFQYGCNVANGSEPARSYWAAVIGQDFLAAAQLLERQSQYGPRRKREAALLRAGLAKLLASNPGKP